MLGKKGFQLSISMLVTVILGTVILVGGFVLVKTITEEGEELIGVVGSTAQQKIDRMLADGSRVAVPDNVKSGTYGSYIFSVGYRNMLAQKYKFQPVVAPIDFVALDGTRITDASQLPQPFMEEYVDGILLDPKEAAPSFPVKITIKKGLPKGTYQYGVTILYGPVEGEATQPYAPMTIIRINVQ